MRLGLYGGTFDPPHLGHQVVAETVRSALRLDRLDWIPAGQPWQKVHRDVTAAHIRVEMVQAAIRGNHGFGLDLREVDRSGPSYTADTVESIRGELDPGDEVFLVLGTDSAAGLATWHEPERITAACRIVVVDRPGAERPPAMPEGTLLVEVPSIGISSTMVRGWVADGRSIRYLVPEPVEAIIRRRGLYQAAS